MVNAALASLFNATVNNFSPTSLLAIPLYFVGFLFIFKIVQDLILRRLKKAAEQTSTDIDDMVIEIFQTLKPPFYWFLAFYLSVSFFKLPTIGAKILDILLISWIFLQFAHVIEILIDYVARKYLAHHGEGEIKSAVLAINLLAKLTIWILGSLLALSNIGVNVNSLIAGLGIGGIAIAFAVKDILSDLFSSLTIYFDKPFKIGDVVQVGPHTGTVESIGLKTTRIRALRGESIVIPNQKLTGTDIQNLKNMKKRRVAFDLAITYETPHKKITKVAAMIKEAIQTTEDVDLDRVHLREFGASGLIFEIVYHVKNSDYDLYMDRNQEINFKILEKLAQHKINLAYPTRKIFLEKL